MHDANTVKIILNYSLYIYIQLPTCTVLQDQHNYTPASHGHSSHGSDQLKCPLGADCRVCCQVAPIWGIAGVTSWTAEFRENHDFIVAADGIRTRTAAITPSFLPLTQQVDTVPLHWLLSGQVMLLPLNAVWSVIASFVIRVSEGFLMLLTGKWRVEVAPSTARRTTMVATEVMAGLFCQIRNVTYFRSRTRNKTLKTFA